MVLRVYFISTTARRDIRKGQIHVFSVLSSWKYQYEAIDVAAPENENQRNFVIDTGKKSEDGKIVLPQIFIEEKCCGDYLDFLNAIEHEKLQLFLQHITEQEFAEIEQNKTDKEIMIETIPSQENSNNAEKKEDIVTNINTDKTHE